MSASALMNAPGASAVTVLVLAVGLSGAKAAQNAPSLPVGAQILFLGTAGGPPLRADRAEPSTLLIVDGREYLIDCGIGTMRRMIDAGVKSEQIRTIFLTHLHADHDLGLADVMANDFLQQGPTGAPGPINIYGPRQTKELVDAAFRFITVGFRPFAAENPGAYRIVNGELGNPFVTHEFNRDEAIFNDNEVQVTAVENSHYALMSRQQREEMKSYSYRIRTPYGQIVFTGDTGPSDHLSQLAKGADVLVAESSSRDPQALDNLVNSMAARGHWSVKRTAVFRAHFQFEHLDAVTVGQLAAKAGVKAVVLYHYFPEDKSDQAAYAREVKEHFAGPVFTPDDLDRYCMSAGVLRSCLEHPRRIATRESSFSSR